MAEVEVIEVEVESEIAVIEVVDLQGIQGPPGTGTGGGSDGVDLSNHVADTTPHPYYDDQPSFSLYLQNGLI